MRLLHFFLLGLIGVTCVAQPIVVSGMDQENSPLQEMNFEETEQVPVQVQLFSEDKTIQPGQPFLVAIHFDLEEGWHLYWKNPGDAGAPPKIDWQLPQGFSVKVLSFPVPTHFSVGGLSALGYEGSLTLLAEVTPPATLSPNRVVTLKADVQWLACKDSCIPGMPSLSLTLPVKEGKAEKNQDKGDLFSQAKAHLPQQSLEAQFEEKPNHLIVHFDLPPSLKDKIKEAVFYPEKPDLINLNVPQEGRITETDYQLEIIKHSEDAHLQDQLQGLLILSLNSNQTMAFQVNASAKDLGLIQELSDHQTAHLQEATSDIKVSFPWVEFAIAMLAAFGGGLLLNLMPCVLPVLSLKVLGVVQAAGESRLERWKQALAYVFGVLVSFWSLAGLLLVLRASGEEVGWGFQLQEPLFVGFLAALLFVMALNLCGVFEWGTSLLSLGSKKPKRSGLSEALWSGVLATIVATPCTGPFLGASLGFAMTLPPLGSFALFTVMGLGMAIPFFLLTVSPPLLKLLPKPGPWMVVLKQGMGFLLIASVLWLIWVWEAQTDFTAVMLLLASFLVLAIGAWVYGRWGQLTSGLKTRVIAMMFALLSIGGSCFLIGKGVEKNPSTLSSLDGSLDMKLLSDKKKIDLEWESFSPTRFEELKKEGAPIFIDFTAKWCILCQANKVVLHSDEVSRAFKEAGVVKIQADWTKNDPEITRLLKQFKRSGVPLYVLYKQGGASTPIIFPETLTKDMLIDAIRNQS